MDKNSRINVVLEPSHQADIEYLDSENDFLNLPPNFGDTEYLIAPRFLPPAFLDSVKQDTKVLNSFW